MRQIGTMLLLLAATLTLVAQNTPVAMLPRSAPLLHVTL